MNNSRMSGNYIEHHGILGMKWGIRRTPEQLGHKTTTTQSKIKKAREKRKKQEEDAQKKRMEILRDPKKLYRHRKEFSKEEIDDAMKKFESDENLKKIAYKKSKSSSPKTTNKDTKDTNSPKRLSDFSDDEIARMAKRFENEQKIKKALASEKKSKANLDKALKFVNTLAATSWTVASTYKNIKNLKDKGEKFTNDFSDKQSDSSDKKKKSKSTSTSRAKGKSFVNSTFKSYGDYHVNDGQLLLLG